MVHDPRHGGIQDTGVTQIEVTPEMVEVAEEVFLEWMGDEWPRRRGAPSWIRLMIEKALMMQEPYCGIEGPPRNDRT